MALTNISATLGNAAQKFIMGADQSSALAPAHVNVDASGNEIGTTSNPLFVFLSGQTGYNVTIDNGSNFTTSQVAIPANTATLLVAARDGRTSITVTNLGTTLIWIGENNAVTAATGFPLPGIQYSTLSSESGAALYAYATSAASVAVAEEY